MIIFYRDNVRILQHPHLQRFYVEQWDWGDNPRSYGQCYKWCCVLETKDFDEARDKANELLSK